MNFFLYTRTTQLDIKNTKDYYGLGAIALHWIVALGFLGSYVAVYYRHWFTDNSFSQTGELTPSMIALHMHLSFGITIGVFVALRVAWKLRNKTPDEVPGTQFEHSAARIVHRLLYAVMIIMPITGYMGTKLDANYFLLGDIPKFSDTALYSLLVEQWLGMDWESFEPIMDFIHKESGAYVVWVLIALHAGAALYHHFIKKDQTLRRMTTLALSKSAYSSN